MNALLLLCLAATPTPQDLVDGAEIGDTQQYVYFQSHNVYKAERQDKKAGTTRFSGSWSMKDDTLEVKPTSCKGPGCKELNKPYRVQLQVQAERVLQVKSESTVFPSGSYYCHHLGCEPRVGVELLGKDAKAMAMIWLTDFVIDKNRGRNTTTVWWGKKLEGGAPVTTHIETCGRDVEKSTRGADELTRDLSELPWLGKVGRTASADKDCLWDVRLYVADDVLPPPRKP